MKKNILSFVLFLLSQFLMAQNTDEFFPEMTGTIGTRQKVNGMAFSTSKKIDAFFKRIEEDFNVPNFEGGYSTYRFENKNWSDKEIIVRLQPIIQNNLDGSTQYTVFIFAEEKDEIDLLIPSTDSYKLISKYFSDLFNEFIKNGKPESFPKE